jgi:WD40 repeat protein
VEPALRIGAVVAQRYRIERELGQGGMGTVFVALDAKFGARIALKIATGTAADYKGFRVRFAREAQVGNRLGRTPGFVRAFDWGELGGGSLYLAMDLVPDAKPLDLETGSLHERLTRLREAAVLVAEAHKQGVVHRDVKPANFLRGSDGRLWLTDFGLAKVKGESDDAASAAEDPSVTGQGQALGTPAFMPPEQFDDASTCDERADVYALGVMLFLAAAGRLPFEGRSFVNFRVHQEQISSGARPAPRLRDARPGTPASIDELAASAMALDPARRLASSLGFVIALERVLETREARTDDPAAFAATVADAELQAAKAPAAARSRSRVVAGAAATLVLAGGVAALVSARSSSRPGPEPDAATPPAPVRSAAAADGAAASVQVAAPSRFPAECRELLETKAARLGAVLGAFGARRRERALSVALSPDGARVLVGNHGGTLDLWDLATFEPLPVKFEGLKWDPLVLEFLPDGKRALSGGRDGELVVWDLASGQGSPLAAATTGWVRTMAVSPDGKLALTCQGARNQARGAPGALTLWDTAGPTRLASVATDSPHANDCGFLAAPGEPLRAYCVGASELLVWSVAAGQLVPDRPLPREPGNVTAAVASPGGERLLVACRSGSLTLADAQGHTLWSSPKPLNPWIERVAFLPAREPGDERVLCVDSEGSFSVYNLRAKEAVLEAQIPRACGDVRKLAVTRDGKRAVVASAASAPEVLDLETGERRRTGHRGGVRALGPLGPGNGLVSVATDGALKLWDLGSGAEVRTLLVGDDTVAGGGAAGERFFSFNGKGERRLVAGSLEDGVPFEQARNVTAAALSPDGRWLGWGTALGTVALRDLATKDAAATVLKNAHEGAVKAIAFSTAGGLQLVDGGVDGRVVVRAVAHPGDAVHSHAFSPAATNKFDREVLFLAANGDDPRVLVGGGDGKVRRWDFTKDEVVGEWSGATPAVCGALSPDGSRALLSDGEGLVRILELASGGELDRIDLARCGEGPGKDLVYPVAFLPDGRSFVVGTTFGPILRFDFK